MATFSIPNEDGKIIQTNKGNGTGNVYATFNIDLDTNPGKIRVSEQVKKLVTSNDDADFSGYAGAVVTYRGTSGTLKYYAVSDNVFKTSSNDPLGSWTEDVSAGNPDTDNTITDAVSFNGLLLVSTTTDIKSWNDTAWASWWQTTLSQSALISNTYKHLLKVAPDGNLYITDDGTKLYKVTPTSTVSKTGAGTLDISATQQRFTCIGTTSNRMFLGTLDRNEKEAVIYEWDMSAQSTSPNRTHKIGASAVRCIAVWNNTPIAVLSDGRVKYFDGNSFVEWPNIQFPTRSGKLLNENFIHPNGWAIIDNKPHFLVTGRTNNSTEATSLKESAFDMPSGVWCLDPAVGLYHRFSIGSGESTQTDYGKHNIVNVGALHAITSGSTNQTKFLASYEYKIPDGTTTRSVLAYHDNANANPGRAFLVTPFIASLREVWKKNELFHEPMPTGATMMLYSREEDTTPVSISGTWVDTTTINISSVSLGISVGDLAYIKGGPGSGQFIRISNVEESASVTSITLEDANTFASAGNAGVLDVLDFRFMGTIEDNLRDYHEFSIPPAEMGRKRQFLFYIKQPASKKVEIDNIIITT